MKHSAVFCPSCLGYTKIRGQGGMTMDCYKCKGKGFIEMGELAQELMQKVGAAKASNHDKPGNPITKRAYKRKEAHQEHNE